MILEKKIIKLVKLLTIQSISDAGFSSPWIRIRTGGLISIKQIHNMTEYIS